MYIIPVQNSIPIATHDRLPISSVLIPEASAKHSRHATRPPCLILSCDTRLSATRSPQTSHFKSSRVPGLNGTLAPCRCDARHATITIESSSCRAMWSVDSSPSLVIAFSSSSVKQSSPGRTSPNPVPLSNTMRPKHQVIPAYRFSSKTKIISVICDESADPSCGASCTEAWFLNRRTWFRAHVILHGHIRFSIFAGFQSECRWHRAGSVSRIFAYYLACGSFV